MLLIIIDTKLKKVPSACPYHSLFSKCLGGNLRLVSESIPTALVTAGRLEIYLRRNVEGSSFEWGTVCDDALFSSREADVACMQLGFLGAEKYGTDLG